MLILLLWLLFAEPALTVTQTPTGFVVQNPTRACLWFAAQPLPFSCGAAEVTLPASDAGRLLIAVLDGVEVGRVTLPQPAPFYALYLPLVQR